MGLYFLDAHFHVLKILVEMQTQNKNTQKILKTHTRAHFVGLAYSDLPVTGSFGERLSPQEIMTKGILLLLENYWLTYPSSSCFWLLL